MFASENGHTEIVKYLIEAKASLDLQTQVYSATKFLRCDFLFVDYDDYCINKHALEFVQTQRVLVT